MPAVKGCTKVQREMIARVKAAGCEVVLSGGRGANVTVITPSGQRVKMGGLGGARAEANFMSHMRRCGVDLAHETGGGSGAYKRRITVIGVPEHPDPTWR